MTRLDWTIIVVFLLLIVALGLWKSRRAGKSMASFFVAGRSLPWWLAGTSMLATSFASDTPLHVTKQIRELGLGGAWFYWDGIIGGVAIAFLFARLWQRTGIVTDAELIEIRYSGRAAATLRGALALFRGVVLELITLSWVTAGMTKIVRAIMQLPETVSLAGFVVSADVLVVVVLVSCGIAYATVSGLWGVVLTDVLEFGIAMVGAIVLSVVAMVKVGGPSGLAAGLAAQGKGHFMNVIPRLDSQTFPAIIIGVYIGVQWWTSPYVDGSGQRAQRFLACKDQGQALLAGVWNMAVQYVVRTWPWYTVALASLIVFPTLADPETAYPRMVTTILPVGLRGLMVASFFAAFMSTFTGLLNLSASYLSNDLYRRFLRRDESEKHYVAASRVISLGLALIAGVVALRLPSVLGAFRFKMELMAGLGAVAAMRWFWWRVNARTELASLAASISICLGLRMSDRFGADTALGSATRILIIGLSSIVVLVATSLLSRPEPEAKLVAFFRRVRPPAGLWGPIARAAGPGEPGPISLATLGQWAVCVVFIFSAMMGVGKAALGEPVLGVSLLALAAVCFVTLWRWVLGDAARGGSGIGVEKGEEAGKAEQASG